MRDSHPKIILVKRKAYWRLSYFSDRIYSFLEALGDSDPKEFKVIIEYDCQLLTNSINDKINVPEDINLVVDIEALPSYFKDIRIDYSVKSINRGLIGK